MTVTHHISDELLMGYAAGALPQAFDLVVASHVSLNPEARDRLSGMEAIGGTLLEDAPAATVSEDSFETVMARIAGTEPEPEPKPDPIIVDQVLPAPLRAATGSDLNGVAWRSIGRGVKQAIIHDDEHGTARLLAIPGGVEMPHHSHRGVELTLVLQGAFQDEDGRYGRGDLEEADQDTHHTPVAEMGETCICLIATDGRLKFDGWLARMAQPFIGI